VRDVCAATGLLGESIDCVFPEHDFFVDFLTRYYTDLEPNSALVLEDGGEVAGYLLGCTELKRYHRYQKILLCKIIPAVLTGFFKRGYSRPARKFFWWLVWRGWREIPKTPAGGAHFHFNILKLWRDAASTRRLVENFLEIIRLEHPEIKVVWGQMETFGARRSRALFNRLGWEFYDQVKLNKYKYLFGPSAPPHLIRIIKGGVFLSTIYCKL